MLNSTLPMAYKEAYKRKSIQSLLDREMDFVMHRPNVFCNFLCGRQVGRALQTHGKGVELRPPRFLCVVRFNPASSKFLRYS